MIADRVWSALGDVKQFIEPFVGSAAVLLKRPPTQHEKCYEIINDADGFVTNVWRAIKLDPDEVAKWCDWPVNHIDLNARRKVLIASEETLVANLTNDPEYFDAKLAGYWVWCASSWIGSGLTRPNAIPHLARDKGVHSTCKRPHLTDDKGVHSTCKRPHLTDDKGVTVDSDVYTWMRALSQRLRRVKVICGDWTRVCGGNWQNNNKPVGIFMDPPYSTSGRDNNIYHKESLTVAKDVEQWCLKRGANPDYRIVCAGYDDEYEELLAAGWWYDTWKAMGGYGSRGDGQGKANRHRERLFFSPHCLMDTLF